MSHLTYAEAMVIGLAFIVGLHVATATAMIIYFRHDWARIVTGFGSSLRDRTIAT